MESNTGKTFDSGGNAQMQVTATFTSLRGRLTGIALLLVMLFGLCVWYGSLAPAPSMGDYPGGEELVTDYERYIDERVVVSGFVKSTDPTTIPVTASGGETIQLVIRDVPSSVDKGDKLRVYGIVESGNSIRAINVIIVPPRGLLYAWSVSFLAGLWVLYRVFRDWRFDTDRWVVVPRESEISLMSRTQSRRENDA